MTYHDYLDEIFSTSCAAGVIPGDLGDPPLEPCQGESCALLVAHSTDCICSIAPWILAVASRSNRENPRVVAQRTLHEMTKLFDGEPYDIAIAYSRSAGKTVYLVSGPSHLAPVALGMIRDQVDATPLLAAVIRRWKRWHLVR